MEKKLLLDKDIRESLFDFLDETYGKNRILEEKTIGKSRADLVMVLEQELIGIEIKSDADTYARIARQVKDYDIFFDKNIAVVGSSHAHHITEHIPPHWGIITVEQQNSSVDFYILRQPQINPNKTLARKIKILWRPELAHIQEKYNLYAYRQKSKEFVQAYLLETLPESVLQAEISSALFERDYSTIRETINSYRQSRGAKPKQKRKKYSRKKI